jgi:UDP-N-acetylmuramoyl-L-alanyl-D-glutamate--2,6-diaminopimelate ligase
MVRDSYARVYRYGAALGADARISDVRLGAGGSDWTLILADTLGGGELALRSPLVGAFNVSNVTAAATLALALGVKRSDIASRVERLRPVPGRMEAIDLGAGSSAIVDYAHTPDALRNVLESCRKIAPERARLTVVFGCGGDRDRAKRPIMGEIASRLADRVIVTSDTPRSEDPDAIIADILAGVLPGTDVEAIVDRADAIRAALEKVTPGDMVLVAGKGHETYQITGGEKRHFDDREIVRQWVGGGIDEAALA